MSSVYIPKELHHRVAEDAGHRCGYCLSPEAITGIPLTIEHLIPQSLGGATEVGNLWLACWSCNLSKGARISALDPKSGRSVRLFNPREQVWQEHFAWEDSGIRILGKTAVGRATVEALHLNRPVAMDARRVWIAAGRHPPAD